MEIDELAQLLLSEALLTRVARRLAHFDGQRWDNNKVPSVDKRVVYMKMAHAAMTAASEHLVNEHLREHRRRNTSKRTPE